MNIWQWILGFFIIDWMENEWKRIDREIEEE